MKHYGAAMRYLISVILTVCMLASSICAETDYHVCGHSADTCSITVGDNIDPHPYHDHDGASRKDNEHCCETHSHPLAITGFSPDYSHPLHEKQFNAVIPHLFPQDFSRIPFIPPRTIS